MSNTARLRNFIQSFTRLIETTAGDEERIFKEGKPLLTQLISHDDWLPEASAQSSPERYQQHLLHCDPLERFSVLSFVWEPGQTTPVHDHTVWGMVGVLRGAELCEEFEWSEGDAHPRALGSHRLTAGSVDLVSPRIGDIHKVSNALVDHVSISIHVYGANMSAVQRHTFDPVTGHAKNFVSSYSNAAPPHLWDRSKE